MKLTLSVHLAAALFALAGAALVPAHAEWSISPWENNPVCDEEENQYEPVIVDDGTGGCLVAWLDERSGPRQAYVQRLDSSGEPLWDDYGVPVSESSFSKDDVRMVSDGAGGAIVVWEGGSSPTFIWAQRFAPDGSWLWGTTGMQVASEWYSLVDPEITSDTFGGAVITWMIGGSANHVYAQRLNPSGSKLWNSDGVLVCNASGTRSGLCITGLAGGGAAIAWKDTRDTDPRIYAQYVTSAGVCYWADDGIRPTTTSTDQDDVAIMTLGSTVVLAYSNFNGYDPLYVSCQRLSLGGSRVWGSSGVRVSYDNDHHQIGATLALDGEGGVFAAWVDYNGVADLISAQRLTAAGDRQWTSAGAVVSNFVSEKAGPIIWNDGEGGCLVSWLDVRNYYVSIYAQRLDGLGDCRWDADDVEVSPATVWHWHRTIVDDRGGLIAVWDDDREQENADIYAQRVDATDYLGEPQPTITDVTDFPNDQGGQVLVYWDRCYLDDWPWTAVESYSVWARDAGMMYPRVMSTEDCAQLSQRLGLSPERIAVMYREGWTFVESVPAVLDPDYSCPAFTFGDSTGVGIPLAEYRVLAHSADPAIFWEGEPMTGYSVDNLAPGAPLALMGEPQDQGEVLLRWTASGHHDEDLSHYGIYRDSEENVPIDLEHLVGTTGELTFVDPAGAGTWFYQVTAVDAHENESEGSNEIEVLVTSSDAPVVPELPSTFALHARGPNPFADQTILVFDLPQESGVEISVCGVDGRRVAVLAHGTRPAGRHQVSWAGRDVDGRDLPQGVYFAVMRAGSHTCHTRIAYLR